MKRFLLFSAVILLLVFTSSAQNSSGGHKERKVCLVFTGYLNMTMDNMNVNVDSLLKVYKETFYDKNPYYHNTMIARHWYGNDSREVIIITELNSWDDISKADAKRDEIVRGIENNPAMMQFGKAMFSIILPEHHSDDICYVVAE